MSPGLLGCLLCRNGGNNSLRIEVAGRTNVESPDRDDVQRRAVSIKAPVFSTEWRLRADRVRQRLLQRRKIVPMDAIPKRLKRRRIDIGITRLTSTVPLFREVNRPLDLAAGPSSKWYTPCQKSKSPKKCGPASNSSDQSEG